MKIMNKYKQYILLIIYTISLFAQILQENGTNTLETV